MESVAQYAARTCALFSKRLLSVACATVSSRSTWRIEIENARVPYQRVCRGMKQYATADDGTQK